MKLDGQITAIVHLTNQFYIIPTSGKPLHQGIKDKELSEAAYEHTRFLSL